MRPCLRLVLQWAALGASWGCDQTISLGSECPERDGPCPTAELDDDGASQDARATRPGRGEENTAELRDAGKAAGPAKFPALRNASFELADDSIPGAVASISFQPGTSTISPWYTCQPFATDDFVAMMASNEALVPNRFDDTGEVERVLPQDGDTFVTAQPLLGGLGVLVLPLIQELQEPMRAGQPYAFNLDVRTSGTLPAALRVRGANSMSPCGQADTDKLAESPPIVSGGWSTVCFTFTPKVDYTHLLLQANLGALTDTNLYFDNLRPGCGD